MSDHLYALSLVIVPQAGFYSILIAQRLNRVSCQILLDHPVLKTSCFCQVRWHHLTMMMRNRDCPASNKRIPTVCRCCWRHAHDTCRRSTHACGRRRWRRRWRQRRVVDRRAGGMASVVNEMTNDRGRNYQKKGQRDGDDDDDDEEDGDRNSSLSLLRARTSRGVVRFAAVMIIGMPTTNKDCEKGDNRPPHVSLHPILLSSSSSTFEKCKMQLPMYHRRVCCSKKSGHTLARHWYVSTLVGK
jgi:hypothetical protein